LRSQIRGQIWLSRSHDDVIDGYEDEFDEEANEAHDNKPYGSPFVLLKESMS